MFRVSIVFLDLVFIHHHLPRTPTQRVEEVERSGCKVVAEMISPYRLVELVGFPGGRWTRQEARDPAGKAA